MVIEIYGITCSNVTFLAQSVSNSCRRREVSVVSQLDRFCCSSRKPFINIYILCICNLYVHIRRVFNLSRVKGESGLFRFNNQFTRFSFFSCREYIFADYIISTIRNVNQNFIRVIRIVNGGNDVICIHRSISNGRLYGEGCCLVCVFVNAYLTGRRLSIFGSCSNLYRLSLFECCYNTCVSIYFDRFCALWNGPCYVFIVSVFRRYSGD